MSNKLLPCPLCGNERITVDTANTENGYTVITDYYIECSECGLILWKDSKESLIRLWNFRSKYMSK